MKKLLILNLRGQSTAFAARRATASRGRPPERRLQAGLPAPHDGGGKLPQCGHPGEVKFIEKEAMKITTGADYPDIMEAHPRRSVALCSGLYC
jgi:hypothetical protein